MLGMGRREDLCRSLTRTFYLLKHSEFVGRDHLILVRARLEVPAGKIASVSTGECSGPEPAHWSSLPIAIIDNREVGFFGARVGQRLANATFPSDFRYRIACPNPVRRKHQKT